MLKLTYTSLGDLLLQLREMNGLSQSEVGRSVGVKSDFISKLERGERNTTPQLITKLSQLFGVGETTLLNIYHSELILQQLNTVEDIKPIMDLVKKRKSGEPQSFTLPSSVRSSKTLLEDRRKYVRGGRCGKVEGLNLYPKQNGKLSKGDRETLFIESEKHISYIRENHYKGVPTEGLMGKDLEYLDSSLTDGENIQQWNTFFERYRDWIPQFRREVEGNDFGSPTDEENEWGIENKRMNQRLEKLFPKPKGGMGLG